MQEELDRITERIRRWRGEAGLTLQELADNSGVSASTIHKIENGQSVPTIGVLIKVAHGLRRRPNELFEEAPYETPAAVTRAADRDDLETEAGTRLQRIVGGIPNSLIDVWRVTHLPQGGSSLGGKDDRLRYDGEMIILVEEGELTVDVADQRYLLRPQDTLHFKTSQPHVWRNDGTVPVTALVFGVLPRGPWKGKVG